MSQLEHGLGVAPETVAAAARRGFEVAEGLRWQSYDPYDILLSPYADRVRSTSSVATRVLVQVGKRAGVPFRRLLRVPPHEEPKALADFLRAAVMLAKRGQEWAGPYVAELADRLEGHATVTSAGRGWGLGFPYVSRFGATERDVPNIYVTTNVCQALLDEYDVTGRVSAVDAAHEGVRFILKDLGSFRYSGHQWLRYWDGSNDPIVNVQASSASLLARLGTLAGDDGLLQAADRAVAAVLSSQHADGSWPYSYNAQAPFVDGFHTGFTLQGLTEYVSLRKRRASSGTQRAIQAGYTYFKEHLVTPDVLPRGFADGRVSLDGQNLSQCITTFIVCGSVEDVRNAVRLWDSTIGAELRSVTPWKGSPFKALRWTVGPAVLATAYVLERIADPGDRDLRVRTTAR